MPIDFGTLTLRHKPGATGTSGQPNKENRPMADPKTENKEIVNDKARVGDDKARAAAFAEPLKEIGKNEVDFEKDREGVDRELEARSEKNEEGHAKNMEKIERAHEKNEGQPDPKLGRADNGATPVIDPVTGKKSWPAPRVAGIK